MSAVVLVLGDREDLLLLEDAVRWYVTARSFFGNDHPEASRLHGAVLDAINRPPPDSAMAALMSRLDEIAGRALDLLDASIAADGGYSSTERTVVLKKAVAKINVTRDLLLDAARRDLL